MTQASRPKRSLAPILFFSGLLAAPATAGVLDIALPTPMDRVEISVQQPPGNGIADGHTVTNFGKVKVGKRSPEKIYRIKNTGVGTLYISDVKLSDGDKKEFKLTQPKAKLLEPGESTTFAVRFRPAGEGSRTTVLQIKNNDWNESSFDIKLVGKGKR